MEAARSNAAVQAILSAYRKAPVTLSLFASYFISRIVTGAWYDYRIFIALPGGPLPKTILGWSIHYFVLSPLSLSSDWASSKLVRSYFGKKSPSSKKQLTTGAALPRRRGPAPLTAGTIPHRQLDQFASESGHGSAAEVQDGSASQKEAQEAIRHVLERMQQQADSQPSHLRCGSSQIEAHSTALFAVSHTLVTGSDGVSRSTRSALFPSTLSRRFLSSIRGEFVHVHCQPASDHAQEDGSLHMTLHPDDATLVVEQGWGQLHRLAGFPSYSGFWFGWPAWLARLTRVRSARWWTASSMPTGDAKLKKAVGLPPTYCLVYSPRNMEEAKVLLNIVQAAATFAIGSRST